MSAAVGGAPHASKPSEEGIVGLAIVIAAVLVIVAVLGGLLLEPLLLLVLIGALLALAIGVGRRAGRTD